jgi:hypothetical protein
MIGKVYAISPQPPVPDNTQYFVAGNVTIGVEYRELDPDGLVETYKDDPAQLAEMLERSPEGGFTDEGVSFHVLGTEDGHEYVRFDVFDGEPHYHYNHRGEDIVNNVIDFDVNADGDMLPWALDRMRSRLGAMLTEAGGGHLVDGLDTAEIARVVAEVGAIAERAQRAARALRPVGSDGS